MKTNEERLEEMLRHLDRLSHVRASQIPEIPLYMDQVTTFMEEHLKDFKRNEADKVLTKTMINNYAKNNLLPPPDKKKYSKEHMLLLIFIYYYKNLLSISDIETLLAPITENHFQTESPVSLEDIYSEVFSLRDEQKKRLTDDMKQKFEAAESTFSGAPDGEREFLRLFAFISELAFDVYLKKLVIEGLIDQLREENPPAKDKNKKARTRTETRPR
ncbi:MAG TPA: DUF1836 domain-containing protein [Candidatus Lachnoclostridium pullistercoris]|uniref:DUF1836 domain-containing protein n=1 Tax=Candidatus Lachnoclostridium pullistercoris TaxID=2838632 RepID=A0A9D2PDI0_9FIRM|nr:DUF1836 domain-containing protein [Candidatus Lachnoclostridium pullistercoris]